MSQNVENTRYNSKNFWYTEAINNMTCELLKLSKTELLNLDLIDFANHIKKIYNEKGEEFKK